VGCIPSKALLQSSEHFEHAGHAFRDHGIRPRPEHGRAKMVARKDTVVKQNNDGILYLFKKNKVSLLPRPRLVREGGGRRLRNQGQRRCR
jgi:dihydrolipoamide dehydrogenase